MKPFRAIAVLLGAAAAFSLSSGCALQTADEPDFHGEEEEPVASVQEKLTTVASVVSTSCSTSSVKGLSEQIVAQMNCNVPNSMAQVPSRPNLTMGSAVFPFMQSPAKNALVKALDAHPGTNMKVNSMFRTVAAQYVLYRWYKLGKCGISLAATPGSSNHESGLAIDVSQYSTWKSALTGNGFKWLGSSDPVHYDYAGSGAKNLKGEDVLAFQMLWNLNNPGDKIDEDGSYGPQTEARLAKSPAAGFTKEPSCGVTDTDGDGVADDKDNCPKDKNKDQLDTDGDGKGDVCDGDDDGDGVADAADNCPLVENPEQADLDGDTVGDACDDDIDGDGIPNDQDACPLEDPCSGAAGAGGQGFGGAGGAIGVGGEAGAPSGTGQGTKLLSGDDGGCSVTAPRRANKGSLTLVALGFGLLLLRRRQASRSRRLLV